LHFFAKVVMNCIKFTLIIPYNYGIETNSLIMFFTLSYNVGITYYDNFEEIGKFFVVIVMKEKIIPKNI